MLIDTFDVPDFKGKTAEEAWTACVDWEDWMYDKAAGFSDENWAKAVKLSATNYHRYYQSYVTEW